MRVYARDRKTGRYTALHLRDPILPGVQITVRAMTVAEVHAQVAREAPARTPGCYEADPLTITMPNPLR